MCSCSRGAPRNRRPPSWQRRKTSVACCTSLLPGSSKSPARKCWPSCARFWKPRWSAPSLRPKRMRRPTSTPPSRKRPKLPLPNWHQSRWRRRPQRSPSLSQLHLPCPNPCPRLPWAMWRPRCLRSSTTMISTLTMPSRTPLPRSRTRTTTSMRSTSSTPTCSPSSRKRRPSCCPSWVVRCASGPRAPTTSAPAAKCCGPCTRSRAVRDWPVRCAWAKWPTDWNLRSSNWTRKPSRPTRSSRCKAVSTVCKPTSRRCVPLARLPRTVWWPCRWKPCLPPAPAWRMWRRPPSRRRPHRLPSKW